MNGSQESQDRDRGRGVRAKPGCWRRLERWWFAPFVPERLAVLRVAVGAYAYLCLLVLFKSLLHYRTFSGRDFAPVGLVDVLLDQPMAAGWLYLVLGLALLLGPAFICGYRFRLTGPLFALLMLWLMSYRSSWGMIFHTENLMVLHLLILSAAPAADACSLGARRRRSSAWQASSTPEVMDGRYGWPVRLMGIATTSTYAIAGWAKWHQVGWEWFQGETLARQIAYDNLRKLSLGATYSPVGVALLDWDWVFPILAWLTFIFEFGAPLALCSVRIAPWWALGIWSFHLGVLGFMAILFPYPLTGVAFLSFFAVEGVVRRRRIRRLFGMPA